MKYEFEYECDVPWDDMKGGDRTRHCGKCSKNVHHISGMTKEQALKFLNEHDWEVCVDFYCDSDGEMVFKERERRLGLQLEGLKQLTAVALVVAPLVIGVAFIDLEPQPTTQATISQPIDVDGPNAAVQPSALDYEPAVVEPTSSFVPSPPEVPSPDVVEPAEVEPPEEPDVTPPIDRPPKIHLRGRIRPPDRDTDLIDLEL